MKKFRKAQAQNQAAIKKHLKANNAESSSEDEVDSTIETAVEKVLSKYQYEGGDPNKIVSYMTETFQSGGAVCLICISSVKKTDAVSFLYFYTCLNIFKQVHVILNYFRLFY